MPTIKQGFCTVAGLSFEPGSVSGKVARRGDVIVECCGKYLMTELDKDPNSRFKGPESRVQG
jgi:hypothetical protein